MTARPALLPDRVTPSELAAHLGMSERTLRQKAIAEGACRILGKTMFFLPEDISALMEALKPCPTKSTSAARSGTTGAQRPKGDSGALLARLKKPSPRESRQKPKPANGNVILMGQART